MKIGIYSYFIDLVVTFSNSNSFIHFSDLWATAPQTAAMVTRTVISMFHWTFALGLLVLRSCAHITPEPPTNLPDNVECDETPPDCNASHQVIGGLPYTFKSRDHGYVQPVRHELHINTQEPICSLDPTVFVTDTSNRSTPLNLHFQIGCHQMSTRVVIRPTRNLTSALVFAFIEIRNCIIYWKDLSTFGRYVDLRAMLFFNWVDEFVAQQPSFFQQCVELDDLQPGVDGVAPSISDLARVASLLVASSPTCSLPHDTPAHTSSATSPVFTRHMWPLMAGVKFMGYVIISTGKLCEPSGIILDLGSAHEERRYFATHSLIRFWLMNHFINLKCNLNNPCHANFI